jgi:osomolarity two-component system sensor histidine kinase NIK1
VLGPFEATSNSQIPVATSHRLPPPLLLHSHPNAQSTPRHRIPGIVMPTNETTAALAGILSNIAKHYDPRNDKSFPGQVAVNGTPAGKPFLPGPDSPEKQTLEHELAALVARVNFLEQRAVNSSAFPITPSEPTLPPTYPTDSPRDVSKAQVAVVARRVSGAQRDPRTYWVNNWLAEEASERPPFQPQPTEEQLGYIRDHLNKQADQIKTQRDQIEELSTQVSRQQKDQVIAFDHGMEDIGALKRELEKHQQANSAFQKALREIGTIITAVAHGDLGKKVLIHAKELDPEIATFKKTTNKMIDQLQDFASQVTRLAREVGTEGRLGGQAVVADVKGIWAELTDNGMHILRAPLQWVESN